MSILEAKKKYNALLVRERNAEKYLNNSAIPESIRDKWMPEYKSICEQLNALLPEIRSYTPNEIQNGFEVDELVEVDYNGAGNELF